MNVSENNRRIARNTLLLYGRKAVTMLIALYSSRVLLQYLGIDDFGLYMVPVRRMVLSWLPQNKVKKEKCKYPMTATSVGRM